MSDNELIEDDFEGEERGACLTIVVIFVILVAAGVGVWYYITHKTPSTEAPVNPPVVTNPNNPSEPSTTLGTISAKDGGEVSYKDPNGRIVKVIFPAGALAKDTKISIAWVATGPVTDQYHLMPDGLAFLKPVTVVIPYKESGLKDNETPYNIQLEYWFKNSSGVPFGKNLLGFSVDTQTQTLSAQISRF